MRIPAILLLGVALTACGSQLPAPVAGGPIGTLPADPAPVSMSPAAADPAASDPATSDPAVSDPAVSTTTAAVLDDPTAAAELGLIGLPSNSAPTTPLAVDADVDDQVWRLYVEFEARYAEVIDDMQSVLHVDQSSGPLDSIVTEACATRALDGADALDVIEAITGAGDQVLAAHDVDPVELFADIQSYHQQVIALGVCD